MSIRLQLLLIATSLFGTCCVVYLIKRNILEIKYSFVWLGMALLSVLLAIFPGVFGEASTLLGFELPSNALFLFGFYFVFCLLFSLTIIASRNAKRVRILNQELAILKAKYEMLEKKQESKND